MKRYMPLLLLVGCGSSKPPAAPTSQAEESAPPPPAATETLPVCVDENDETVECLSDADCCEGFTCTKDPEGSHLRMVCLYEY